MNVSHTETHTLYIKKNMHKSTLGKGMKKIEEDKYGMIHNSNDENLLIILVWNSKNISWRSETIE